MTEKEINNIIELQREFFKTGQTKSVKFRINQLKLLKLSIEKHYDEILDAFKKDFNKHEFDVITTEIGMVYGEINYFLKHLKSLCKPKSARTSVLTIPSKAKIISEPLGQVLIMSPWNYPFQLAIVPLVGAIAGGNTAIVKPSAYSSNVSKVISLVLSVFDKQYIAVVLGGRNENQDLLNQKFDLIFFTGSKEVGRIVQEKASKYLCPVILELGGKSPCIIDEDANLVSTIKRAVWGKFLNAGQTCIAPDYFFVHKNIYTQFIAMATNLIKKWYYDENGKILDTFPHIINDRHTERLKGYIDPEKVVCGGKVSGRLIEPTILKNIDFSSKVMQEEIFGPIMPIIPFENLDNVINYINNHDKPLALYFFGQNKKTVKKILYSTTSGGVCINDTIMHFVEKGLPFGGVGESGMGHYHGKNSFKAFTHEKPVLYKHAKIGLDVQYPLITKTKQNLVCTVLGVKHKK